MAQLTSPPLVTPPASDAPFVEPEGPKVSDAKTRLDVLKNEPTPSLAGPITVLAVGVGFLVGSAAFAYAAAVGLFSLTSAGATAALVFLIVAGVALVPGLVMTIAGARWLTTELRARRDRSRELKALEQQLRRPEAPLAPPTVPSVSAPSPALLLATC